MSILCKVSLVPTGTVWREGTPGSPVVLAIPFKSRTDNLDSPVFPSKLVLIAEALQNVINVYISAYESKLFSSSERPLTCFFCLCAL